MLFHNIDEFGIRFVQGTPDIGLKSPEWGKEILMKKLFASAALAAAVVVPAFSMADTPTTAVAAPAAPAAAEAAPNSGALSLTGGVDYVTEYFFRGYKSSPAGVILQPYAQLNVSAYKSDNFSITPYVGTWNDLQDSQNATQWDSASRPTSHWFECDVYGGITWGLPENFKLDTIYTLYTSPANEFATTGELGFKLAYDDTSLLKDKLPLTFQPYVAWYFETLNDGTLANGSDGLYQYAEVGFTPTYAIGDTKLTATMPIWFGFSPDSYYFNDSGQNDAFGSWAIGAYLTYQLPFAAKYGAWALTGGVTYEQMVAQSTKDANNGADHEWLGKVSLTFAY